MKKFDMIMYFVYSLFVPGLMALILIYASAMVCSVISDEISIWLLNIGCVLALMWIGGALINVIWNIIVSIIDKNKKGEEHNE